MEIFKDISEKFACKVEEVDDAIKKEIEYREELELKVLNFQSLYLKEKTNREKELREKVLLQEKLAKMKEKLQKERDIVKAISEDNENLKVERDLLEEDLKWHKKELSENALFDPFELQEKIEELSLDKEKLQKEVAELKEKVAAKPVPPQPAAAGMNVGMQQNFVFVPAQHEGPGVFIVIDLNKECHRLYNDNCNLVHQKSACLEMLEKNKIEMKKLKQELGSAYGTIELYKHLSECCIDFIQDEEIEPVKHAFKRRSSMCRSQNQVTTFNGEIVIMIPSDDER